MKCYVILNKIDVTNSQINSSNSHSLEEARVSKDGLKVVFEFDSSNLIAEQEFLEETWYNSAEINLEMLKDNWQPETLI